VLLFWEVNADAALTISWRRVDEVAGQMHVGADTHPLWIFGDPLDHTELKPGYPYL
jgi:hypothetical protein